MAQGIFEQVDDRCCELIAIAQDHSGGIAMEAEVQAGFLEHRLHRLGDLARESS